MPMKNVRSRALQDEIEARLEALAATEDNAGVSREELEATALKDIAELSADDHGCMDARERQAWNRIRRGAAAELGVRL